MTLPVWTSKLTRSQLILEAWGEGWFLGFIIVLIGLTISNMSRRRILHILILVELLLVIPRSTIILSSLPTQNYYVASFNALNYIGYFLHGIIAWIKIKPFLTPRWSAVFINCVLLTSVFWVVHIYANFEFYIHSKLQPWTTTRALYVPFREPFWIIAGLTLLYNIKTRYNFSLKMLVTVSPRFGVMLVSMILSVIFAFLDMGATIHPFTGPIKGVNPFWKMARAFCCFTDVIILDDFKTALDRIRSTSFSYPKNSRSYNSQSGKFSAFRSGPSKVTTDIERAGSQIELNDTEQHGISVARTLDQKEDFDRA